MLNKPRKFFGKENNIENWMVFFNYFDKSLKILDFGCGAGWGIYLGRKLGYDIEGLDSTGIRKDRLKQFNDFRDEIGVSKYVKLYNGCGALPYLDNSFSLIVCRASFNKFRNTQGLKNESELAIERLKEFDRILIQPKIVVITGNYFKKEFSKFNFKVYNWKKFGVNKLW